MPGRRLRESCDFCAKRKRKCDGDGVNHCSFCVTKNRPECHYSVRRPTGPRPDSVNRRASEGLAGKAAAKATTATAGGCDDSGSSGELGSDHRRCSRKLPLKRARLSPSPATGLIGLRENVYIAEFFRTVGFVPFTTESSIRKAMVRTMFRVVQDHEPGFHRCLAGFGGGEQEEKAEEGRSGGGAIRPGAGIADKIETAGGACVLWCTVAVGCLVGGRPISSVEGYARLAREALSGCFDDMSIETARAFTAMALLEDFRGNETKFSKYIDFASSIMSAWPAKEVPADLADAHMFVKVCDTFDGFYDLLGEEDLTDAMGAVSGLAKQTGPIQQAELCRWLLKTDIRLSACFSMDMQSSGFFGNRNKHGTGPASGSHVDGSGALLPNEPPYEAYDTMPGTGTGAGLDTPMPRMCWRRPLSDTSAAPPPPGPISQKFAARVLADLKLMMHVIQRPEVRGSVGELCFQSIMAYACSLQGQRKNAVGATLRCTDILVENPGILRSTSWKHLVHVCLTCMVVSGNAEKYEELRTSHNFVVDSHAQRAPRFEEFGGITSICSNIFCTSVDNIFKSIAALKIKSLYRHCDGASATPKDETRLRPPKTEIHDVDMNSSASTASDETWARGVFDKRRRRAGMKRGKGKRVVPSAPGAVAAAAANLEATAAPAVSSAGASGSTSCCNSITSRGSISNASSNSMGPAPAGNAAALTAAPSTAAGQDGNRCPGQGDPQEGFGEALLPLLPSAQTSTAPSDVRHSSGGLELLCASELEGAEAADLLDAVDTLLGEAVLEGFGEGGNEENVLPEELNA